MNNNSWTRWNVGLDVGKPPKNIVIKAYVYYDPLGKEYVGTIDEILPSLRLRTHFYDPSEFYGSLRNKERAFMVMWKLTGIGKEQLNGF